MTDIQTDVSDEALVTAIRANMCEIFKYMGKSTHEEYFENEDFARWYTPLPHPWFNGVLSTRPPADGDEAFVEEAIHYFRDQKVDMFTWWLDPKLKPADWEPLLSDFDFGFSNDAPGMAVDLQTLNESFPLLKGLEIKTVDDESTLRSWIKVFIPGNDLPAIWESKAYDLWSDMGLDFPLRNYIGYWNGQPVSTSTVFYGGGVAGIYSVTTLTEARGKGIGTALTLKPLLDARDMGYRVGVLQSSDMGFNIYKRLGFRHLCQIENFYLML